MTNNERMKLITDYETMYKFYDKAIYQRFINLLIDHKMEYLKKGNQMICIKDNYWDFPKEIQDFIDDDNNVDFIHWI